VPKTLLAVDDSATMRKVLEITFAGEDFRVVTAEGASTALARMGNEPAAALIDTSLGGDDSYALAKEMRSRDGRIAVVMLASRYTPYDTNRGRDAGVDDFIDKPFDTQALIDKVKKALVAREARVVAPPPAAPVASHSPPVPLGGPSRGPAPTAPVIQAKPVWPTQRSHTLSFEGTPPGGPQGTAPPLTRTAPGPGGPPLQHHQAPPQHQAAPPAPAAATQAPRPPPAPVAQTAHTVPTAPPRAAEPAPTPAFAAHPRAAAAAVAANGQLAGKLGELGLTPQQVDAVLALSREVVERVVWEVVPQLAEVMIKEEIARLTSER
jgi:DNA-binding response OmpR family regulator